MQFATDKSNVQPGYIYYEQFLQFTLDDIQLKATTEKKKAFFKLIITI